MLGSIYALIGFGFGLVYRINRTFHFGHAIVLAATGYVIYSFSALLGWPIVPALVASALVAALLGSGVEALLYRPLRKRQAPRLMYFLVAFGGLSVVSGILQLAFGEKALFLHLPMSTHSLGDIALAGNQVFVLVAAPLVLAAMMLFFRTRAGTAARALADNPERAETVGVNSARVYFLSIMIGSAIAVLPVFFLVSNRGTSPSSGILFMFYGILAAFVGGVGSMPGHLFRRSASRDRRKPGGVAHSDRVADRDRLRRPASVHTCATDRDVRENGAAEAHMSAYLATVVVFISIFAMLAWTYDLLLGVAGLFSVAHIAFYAIGAYAVVLLTMNASVPFALAVLIAIAGQCGHQRSAWVPDDAPRGRLSGRGHARASLHRRPGRPAQLAGTHRRLFRRLRHTGSKPVRVDGGRALAVRHYGDYPGGVMGALFYQIGRSRLGLALRALREDEVAATSHGYPVAMLKTTAFMIASSLVVVPGALYASFIGYIDPPTFDISLVVLVLAMVVVGGSGTVSGPVVGALLLVALPDVIVFLTRGDTEQVGPLRQIFYGLALVGFALFRPSGIVPRHPTQMETTN